MKFRELFVAWGIVILALGIFLCIIGYVSIQMANPDEGNLGFLEVPGIALVFFGLFVLLLGYLPIKWEQEK